jgi:hypothetical protein
MRGQLGMQLLPAFHGSESEAFGVGRDLVVAARVGQRPFDLGAVQHLAGGAVVDRSPDRQPSVDEIPILGRIGSRGGSGSAGGFASRGGVVLIRLMSAIAG